ncbi:polysaccharide biosynthesis tyrosine autokinase [Flavobacteriaceae bacterium F89]|uniref:non-specific protein-tyrosine kinase n=1 Tax=Cerina litoralis TaxID=2874477 RepID=A0AAE3JPY9_9FLAO|nr:polysaccharide biosynthesis tyrosine autokinase [Cerina litoralis]MCG2462615.1 polysaccharide biosynthesis tyrosine autokinase [Cerina litoralis]
MTDAPINRIYAEERANLKEEVFKYLYYWPWFVLSLLVFMSLAYTYLRYTPKIYQSTARIKVLDESKELDLGIEAPALVGRSSFNLENEVAVLKSYRLLAQVVEDLKLTTDYYMPGNLRNTTIWNPPIEAMPSPSGRNIGGTYLIEILKDGYRITNENGSEQSILTHTHTWDTPTEGFPFTVNTARDNGISNYVGFSYLVVFKNFEGTVRGLSGSLNIQGVGQESEILSISLAGENKAKSEAILNKIVDQFNLDGIKDRQLVSQRTIDFVDDRFVYLESELDSIETNKEEYKQKNSLSYIEADAGVSVQKKTSSEDQVFAIETQIELGQLIKNSLDRNDTFSLIPSDIGINSMGISALIEKYNGMVLEREKLTASAGEGNPSLEITTSQLEDLLNNVVYSVDEYIKRLSLSLKQLKQENKSATNLVSSMPEKEKILRSIERQQNIKESLYLLLLQKREEAAINLAITAPSIKVVDYALSSGGPIYPNRNKILGGALLLGFLLPIGIIYVRFILNTKLGDKQDLEKVVPEIPIVGEVPYIKDRETRQFTDLHDRSILAESFRILGTNINYMLLDSDLTEGRVIYVTSTIKGEGKTFAAVNLSLAYASLDNRVLLIGADLRNPQLHTYMGVSKNTEGLADYLTGKTDDWQRSLMEGPLQAPNYKVLIAGAVPHNSAELLANKRFKKLLDEAKKSFDYIVIDTAPTILVTDTLLISKFADATLFLTRTNYTEKKLLKFAHELNKHNKLKNMMFVMNGVGAGKTKAYGYNYGYSYGYGPDGSSPKKWYKKFFKR